MFSDVSEASRSTAPPAPPSADHRWLYHHHHHVHTIVGLWLACCPAHSLHSASPEKHPSEERTPPAGPSALPTPRWRRPLFAGASPSALLWGGKLHASTRNRIRLSLCLSIYMYVSLYLSACLSVSVSLSLYVGLPGARFFPKYRTLAVPVSVAQNIELFTHALSGISIIYRTKSQHTRESG